MNIIGIDPGKGGGIACLSTESYAPQVLSLKDKTEHEIAVWLESVAPNFAIIERVHSTPQMGVTSAFSFGQTYGFLRGLMAGRISFDEVTPQRWQKALGCLSKGDKNVTKARAQQLFPMVKCTHGISDALLIAEYARRLKAGEL